MLLNTTGSVDRVRTDGGSLSIEGWAADVDGSPVDGFHVTWGGQPVPILEAATNLASPDVAAARPDLPKAASCRFRLVGRAPTQNHDVLLWLTPLCGEHRGRGLQRVVDPVLPMPSEELVRAIGGGFEGVAFEMLGHFVERAGLRPEDRVLDVGCGVGRIAYALAYYLNVRGRYDGFDIMRPLVDWASTNIGERLPNFHFRHVDLYNGQYNPQGTIRSEAFTFPYPDAVFDFVCLVSVFTHMHGPDVRRYLAEIARVLARGGRVVITAFVLTPAATALIRAGKSTQPLVHAYGDGFVADLNGSEAAVGYDEAVLWDWIERSGLRVAQCHPGNWCGRSPAISYQDVIVLTR